MKPAAVYSGFQISSGRLIIGCQQPLVSAYYQASVRSESSHVQRANSSGHQLFRAPFLSACSAAAQSRRRGAAARPPLSLQRATAADTQRWSSDTEAPACSAAAAALRRAEASRSLALPPAPETVYARYTHSPSMCAVHSALAGCMRRRHSALAVCAPGVRMRAWPSLRRPRWCMRAPYVRGPPGVRGTRGGGGPPGVRGMIGG
jgi:hypothetical protein